jgi:phenylacetate-coenzyme A ligase PaaK-like adenylate-forming protein
MDIQSIFGVKNSSEFNALALKTYEFQFHNNLIYRDFCNYLGKIPGTINSIVDIPFLPIEFFKTKKIVSKNQKPEITFTSSGTTGSHTSKHHVIDLKLYQESYLKGFTHFYGAIEDYCILALFPLIWNARDLHYWLWSMILSKKATTLKAGFIWISLMY